MVEEVDADRRRVKGPFHAVVVYDVLKPSGRGVLAHGPVELFPVAAALHVIDLIIEREEIGMFFSDVVHNDRPVAPAEVEALEPDEAALIADPVNYRWNISNPREYRRYEAGGPYPCVMDFLHRRKAPLNAHGAIHILTEGLVKRVDREPHPGVPKCLYKVKVAQNQIRLGLYAEPDAAAPELLKKRPGSLVFLLLGVVGIRDRAEEELLSGVFPGVFNGRPVSVR